MLHMPNPSTEPVDRRRFLALSGLAAAGTLTAPLTGVATRLFAAGVSEEAGSFPLDETTISELAAGMRSGQYTAVALSTAYLERIAAVDQAGVALRSVIEINPEAIAIAAARDRERRAGLVRGPLHGVPVLIKDNIDTADRMQTTAGSLALVGSPVNRDAFLIRRLREAGAVILGKTNLSEWANFRSTRSTSGWSARGGQTRNPYAPDRNPCGSSSGSAAAIAANFAAAAVGTETDGSIICPASTCGIVGIKPTLGLVSRSGIIPIASSQDTAGPMARTVADAALLLSALTGIDSLDPITLRSRGRAADYTQFLTRDGLRGKRIGVARTFFGFHDKVDRAMGEAIEAIKSLGATVIDPADIKTRGKYGDAEYEVLLYEFKAQLNAYLAARPGAHPPTLAGLIEFNEQNSQREMPYFGQEIFLAAEKKGPLTSPAYRKARRDSLRLAADEGIDATMRQHQLDLMIAPSGGPAWMTDLALGDHYSGGYSSASAIAGYPHITVPAGYVHGLPVGISFFAGAWSEPTLIAAAYAFEQETRARKPPPFQSRVTPH